MNDHVSIIGICCSRDVFGMQNNDGGYTIDRFVQSVNPVALQMESMLKNKDYELPESIFEGKTNFYKRNISLDLNKNVFDYMSEKKSDWLVIDAGAFRKRIFFTPDKTRASTLIFPETAYLLKESGCIYDYKSGGGDIFDLHEDLVNKKLDEYVENILRIYPSKKIILIEYYNIRYYYNHKQNTIETRPFIYKENELMRFGFYELKKRIDNVHIIYFPENVIGDIYHKWGKSPLHYVHEYYQYAFECFNIIKNEFDHDKELLELLKKKLDTENLIKTKYGFLLESYLSKKERQYRDLLRFKHYEQFFKDMLIHDGETKIKNFLIRNRIKNVSIYGLSEIGKLFIEYFLKWDITVSFIVENYSNKNSTYKSIKKYQRDTTIFEQVDAMIICDIDYEKIESLLKKNDFSGRYYNYTELVQ